MTGHVAGHVTGQTRFGHVTFPQSRASEVPESRFVTGPGHQRTTQDASCVDMVEEERGDDVVCSTSGDVAQGKRTRSALGYK